MLQAISVLGGRLGAASCGIDAVLVDREGGVEAPEAVAILPDLRGLPALVRS